MPITSKTRGVFVTSGKGGVGKSLFSVGLAAALSKRGPTGLLDIDTRSPNIPCILGIDGPATVDKYGDCYPKEFSFGGPVIGAEERKVPVWSSAFIFGQGKSVTMPGEQVRALIREFIIDVMWPDVKWLVLDVDPGPGDSITAVLRVMSGLGAFVVTAPDVSSIADGDRMLDALDNEGIKALGVVGNMVGASCPSCHATIPYGDVTPISELARKHKTPFLGYLPWDPIYRNTPVQSVQVQGWALFNRMAEAVVLA